MSKWIVVGILALGAFFLLFKKSGTSVTEIKVTPGPGEDYRVTTPVIGDCGVEVPVGSGCYPYATGGIEVSHCQANCNTRCSDIYGNYKPCDNLDPFWNVPNPYACAPDVPVDSTGYYPDTFGNLMKNCVEVCHRGDSNCAHNLPLEAGNWRFVYD